MLSFDVKISHRRHVVFATTRQVVGWTMMMMSHHEQQER
jgi:hypothetical protein